MAEVGSIAVFGLVVAVLAVLAVRFGILLGRWLDRAALRNDEEGE